MPGGNSGDVGGRCADVGSSPSIDNTTPCITDCVTIRSDTPWRGHGERAGNIARGCAVGERRAGSEPGSPAVSSSRKERC